MKICPKCSKTYDDTWKVCLNCSVLIVDAVDQELLDIKSEVTDVRHTMSDLNVRLNRIEYFLENRGKVKYEPTPSVQESMAKKSDEPKISEPLELKKEQALVGSERGKKFIYTWSLPAQKNIAGEFVCQSHEELKAHIKSLGGELIRIVDEKEVSLRPKADHVKTKATSEEGKPIRNRFVETAPEPKKSLTENFEQMLGEKWFNKLGIFAVVIGVALLIGYSFKYLGPIGKIGIGFAFGLGMLIFGRYIEKKKDFSIYGKGLIGGGWAITYFTTFAMHHIPTVRLIGSPFFGMVLLIVVSLLTVVDIYQYKSQVATGFSYLLIFITLMISPVSVFTMLAAIPVALSLIFFMQRMKWMEFGLYGMFMTYVTYMGWFKITNLSSSIPLTHEQFFIAVMFLALYWVIFVCAAFFSDKDSKSKFTELLGLNVGMEHVIHILNTFIASYIGWMLIGAGHAQHLFLALKVACAAYLGLTILGYFFRKKLALTSSSFSIIYAAIYVSLKYTGYSLTVSYLVLAETVLLAGVLLKEKYWRIVSFSGLLFIIAKLLTIDSFFTRNTAMTYHLSTRTLLFGVAFSMYFLNTFLYGKLKASNLLAKVEENHPNIISYSYPLIFAVGTWLDLPKVLTAPCWILLGVILLQIGVSKNNFHQRMQGYILTTGAFVRLLMSNMLIQGGLFVFSYRLLTSVPVLLVLYYCLMLLQDEKTKSILEGSEKRMVYLYPYMVFVTIMVLSWYEVPKSLVAPVWGMIAVIYSLRGVYSKEKHYLSISSIAALSACVRAVYVNLYQGKYLVGAEENMIFPIITVGLLYAGNIFYLLSKVALKEIDHQGEGKIKTFLHSSRLVYGLAATVLLTALLAIKLDGALLTVGLGIEGLCLFLVGIGFKEKQWRIYGLLTLLLTLAKAFLVDLRQLSTLYYILSLIALGVALLFVSYIYTKHKDKIKKLI